MKDIITIDSNNARIRIVLILVVLFVAGFAWFSVRWQFGNMLANLTQPSDPNAAPIATLAEDWSPADPAAYLLLATVSNDTSETVKALERAVRLAPNDYRWRTELGRAYEQNDQADLAESEFRKAVEFAPSYGSVHWHFGNFLLRRERGDEAIAELKKAAENNHDYRDQVFSLAWDYFDKDAKQVETLVGDKPEVRAQLAYFFAARGKADDALRNWNMLSESEKGSRQVVARSIATGLFDQKHFRQSLEFSKQHGAEIDSNPGQVTNGSFEKNISDPDDQRFGWLVVRNDPKLEIVADSRVAHSGTRSIRLTFKGFAKPALANLFQTVVVEPLKKYELRFWVRTENLKSAGLPMIEILNANDDTTVMRSQNVPDGTTEWREFNIEFTSPENCQGISVRTIRAFCGEDCPISGILWYDDFDLRMLVNN